MTILKNKCGSSLVAGGAGFIGTQLVERLLYEGRDVIVVDNFSRGQISFLAPHRNNLRLHVVEADVSVRQQCERAFNVAAERGPIGEVWHLAANSDIPAGIADPDIDFKDTFCTTYELLRCMREYKVKLFNFASSSAIYGDLGVVRLHEEIGPLLPISNYGAMKLASEAQASAAAEGFLDRVNLYRFPNVVGIPATHGVIMDFVKKLSTNPRVLNVLGNGSQQKSYLHVTDLVDAMLTIRDRNSPGKVEVVNIGPVDEGVTVGWIAEQVVARISPGAEIVFGHGNKGWIGDVPRFNYSTDRIHSYGWVPKLGSAAAITRAVNEIAQQLGF